MNEWMSLSHSFRLDTYRLDWRWHDGIGADRLIDRSISSTWISNLQSIRILTMEVNTHGAIASHRIALHRPYCTDATGRRAILYYIYSTTVVVLPFPMMATPMPIYAHAWSLEFHDCPPYPPHVGQPTSVYCTGIDWSSVPYIVYVNRPTDRLDFFFVE
jgi:hypothetical protein